MGLNIAEIESYLETESQAEARALGENPIAKNLYSSRLELYNKRFELNKHLDHFVPKGVVWDMGCGTGEALDELVKTTNLSVLGVNYPKLNGRNGRSCRAPIVPALMEQLATKVYSESQKLNYSDPNIIIFSNSFRYSVEFSTEFQILYDCKNVLDPHGSILIYDNLGFDVYINALQAVEKMWPVYDFNLNHGSGEFPWYLHITKRS